MNNIEKIKNVFSKSLEIKITAVVDDLSYGSKKWDSVAHMALIAALESEFDIMIDTNDVIEMSNFSKAKEIVARYGVDFNA